MQTLTEPETALDLRVLAATSRARTVGVAKVPAKVARDDRPPVEFKDWLITRMDDMGLSIAELARRSGADGSSITNLRSGTAKPGIRILRKLAKGLDAQLPELLLIAKLIEPGDWEGPVSQPLTPIEREIRRRLGPDSPLSEKGQLVLERHLHRALDLYDEVYADVHSETQPTLRGRR